MAPPSLPRRRYQSTRPLRAVYKMQLDADKPAYVKPREQLGEEMVSPDRIHLGGYVGYLCIDAENVGLNGFVEKQRVKPKVRITADNSANANADKPPGPILCSWLPILNRKERKFTTHFSYGRP